MYSHSHRISTLAGEQKALLRQKREMIIGIEDHSDLINNQDEVYAILSELQAEFSEGKVGLYSELLTAIIRDVMGEGSPAIELKASMVSKKPSLDIYSIKDGHQEDVVSDKGGSINNLISAGLRFIGLALSSNRRLAILDEADCWVQTDLVAPFISVIEKLCEQLGVQAVFISHHAAIVEQMELAKVRFAHSKPGVVKVEAEGFDSPGTSIAEGDERFNTHMLSSTGVRSIRLTNYMSHDDSLIPLAPGLTVIVGNNDIGKSVVTRALSDLLTNNRNPARIKHDNDIGSVELAIEDGHTIRWAIQAQSKGLPKAMYSLLDDKNNIVQIDEGATEIPQWVNEYLAMAPVNGLDLHIGHQKDPLFVLNPAISKHKRAQLIHLGSELEQVNAMMRQHRDNVLHASREVKRLKQEAGTINESLDILKPLATIEPVCSQTKQALEHEIECMGELKELDQFLAIKSEASVDIDKLVELVDCSHAANYHHDCQLLRAYGEAKSYEQRAATIQSLHDLTKSSGLNQRTIKEDLASMEEFADFQSVTPEFEAMSALLRCVSQQSRAEQIEQDLNLIVHYAQEHKEVATINDEIALMTKEVDDLDQHLKASGALDICPTCQQPITQETGHEIHHH